ncbi:MAG: hypothetical protein DI585_05100 [Pseudomonas fluorescens]|nr:MAG: hypothetical protein DI585_05100 [Pseudomonas fluorescens]
MRVCSCAERFCQKNGPCDVQAAVDRANLHRQTCGKPPLMNRHVDVELAVGQFYDTHKAETGKKPCHGCKPLVRQEVREILAGGQCEGAMPRMQEVA